MVPQNKKPGNIYATVLRQFRDKKGSTNNLRKFNSPSPNFDKVLGGKKVVTTTTKKTAKAAVIKKTPKVL